MRMGGEVFMAGAKCRKPGAQGDDLTIAQL
jgi:hypothetical protein